jgi:hypothetical protein
LRYGESAALFGKLLALLKAGAPPPATYASGGLELKVQCGGALRLVADVSFQEEGTYLFKGVAGPVQVGAPPETIKTSMKQVRLFTIVAASWKPFRCCVASTY